MNTATQVNPDKTHRFQAEVISPAVWLYCRFCLSYRDVEELLFVRGVIVTYEAMRQWCRKLGQQYAHQLRRWRPRPGDKWHLDEVFLTINGERHYLWRAVDRDGNVLDILGQRRRDKQAATKFFRKLRKGWQYVPRVIVTDKRKSYDAAKREVWPSVEHRQHRYLTHSTGFRGGSLSSFTMRLKLLGVTSMLGRPRQRPNDLGVAYAPASQTDTRKPDHHRRFSA